MSVQEKYSKEEWDLLTTAPMLVGAAMSGADGSGLFGTLKEAFASSQAAMAARSEFADNALIAALMPVISSFSEAREQASAQQEKIKARLQAANAKDAAALQAVAIEDLSKVQELLDCKEDAATATAYKNFIIQLADKVANAASEGGFLGFGGTRFSDGEKSFLEKVKTALQTDLLS
ncbi:MAG: hypothetical protein IPL35_14320 [Sphingobacteriales bacterium]|nr:hypothetical protein [Sphingobacteriales bacterium]